MTNKTKAFFLWLLAICMPIIWQYAATDCPMLNEAWAYDEMDNGINFVAVGSMIGSIALLVCAGFSVYDTPDD